MSGPSNAREALIAELVGEVSALLDRVDTLVPAINAACDAAIRAGAALESSAGQAERRIAAFTEAAKAHAVEHIAKRTNELARSAGEAQLVGMRKMACEVARTELATAFQQMLRQHLQQANCQRAGSGWWTYAITALCAAALGAVLAAYALSIWAP